MQMADAMVSSGMADAGYTYVNLDAGWLGGRGADGTPHEDKRMFPSGMAALVEYVHSKGLKFGIYRDRHLGQWRKPFVPRICSRGTGGLLRLL